MWVVAWVWFGGMACGTAVPPADDEPAAEVAATAGRAEAEDLAAAVRAWRAKPDPALLAAVRHATDRGLAVPNPSPELEVVLGDALANVLLRPDLGVPRLERHAATLTGAGRDAWLDALVRDQQLPRFAAELERTTGRRFDAEHTTARAIAAQAALDAAVGWRAVVDGTDAARRIEQAMVDARVPIDRPMPPMGGAFEALAIVLEGWTLDVAAARTTFPADGDPLTTPGEIPAADDRRRVVGFASGATPEALRDAGVRFDLAAPRRAATIGAEATSPDGGRLSIAISAVWRDDQWRAIATGDPTRLVAWLDAAEALTELRRAHPEGEARRRLRATFQDRVMRGR